MYFCKKILSKTAFLQYPPILQTLTSNTFKRYTRAHLKKTAAMINQGDHGDLSL